MYETNEEMLFRARIAGDSIFATPITGAGPAKALGKGYYYVPSRPYALRAGVLVNVKDPCEIKSFSANLVCFPEDFPDKHGCTYVAVDGFYYEVLKKTKTDERYRSFGDVRKALNETIKRARSTYDEYLKQGGCCFFVTLTVKKEHYQNMDLEKSYSFLRDRLKNFRKGMGYCGNNLRPAGEIYFFERYYATEPKFHIHAFFFYKGKNDEKEIRQMIKKYWHIGRISVKKAYTPEVLEYPGVNIPGKYEKLKDAATWLWANRPEEQDAIRFLNSRQRFYPQNRQVQILRRKLFGAMYFPRGKSPIAVYGEVSDLEKEMELTLEQFEEMIQPETFTTGTLPITDKLTGRKVSTVTCISGKLKTGRAL